MLWFYIYPIINWREGRHKIRRHSHTTQYCEWILLHVYSMLNFAVVDTPTTNAVGAHRAAVNDWNRQ